MREFNTSGPNILEQHYTLTRQNLINKGIEHIKETFSAILKLEKIKEISENCINVKSDLFYSVVNKLTSKVEPSFKDDFESWWKYFYLPADRNGELICIPVSIFLSYKKVYYIKFLGFSKYGANIAVIDKGDDKFSEPYVSIFKEISDFIPLIYEYGEKLPESIYPYEWRSGEIKRKYIKERSKLMPKEEGSKLLQDYNKFQKEKQELSEISVNDYLNTAAICYRAAFSAEIPKLLRRTKTKEATPVFLHQCFADDRHGGMLFIKDADSKKEYTKWYKSRKWKGAHPFEIVYSATSHGIYLYPPTDNDNHYRLSVSDDSYNLDFLKMLDSLIKSNIPFDTNNLEDIIQFCTGEAYIEVNSTSMYVKETFYYEHTSKEQKNYFSHIKWNKFDILR